MEGGASTWPTDVLKRGGEFFYLDSFIASSSLIGYHLLNRGSLSSFGLWFKSLKHILLLHWLCQKSMTEFEILILSENFEQKEVYVLHYYVLFCFGSCFSSRQNIWRSILLIRKCDFRNQFHLFFRGHNMITTVVVTWSDFRLGSHLFLETRV